MNFSPEWDQAFRAGTHISLWPWSDLVSYVSRHAKPDNGYRSVFELGCGVGANIPFFLGAGFDYRAVEGSAAAVEKVHARYPELRNKVVAADFTKELPFAGPFDLIVDRSALAHNTTAGIEHALRLVAARLRRGGKLIGIDWFSTAHQDAASGDPVDSHTRAHIPSGHLSGLGVVHFSDQPHLEGLLGAAGFIIERLEQKVSETVVPQPQVRLAWLNFVAVRI